MKFQLKNMKIEMSLVCLFLSFFFYPILSFYLEPFLYEKILKSLYLFTFTYIMITIIITKDLYLIPNFLTLSLLLVYCSLFIPMEYKDDWLLIKNKNNCSIIQKNMKTNDVYWKCDDGIIYVNKHEN